MNARTIAVFCLMSVLLAVTVPADAQRRTSGPRIGVVLSGGGAKGTAHIGALKAIEEAGIPIDIVTGTSMGSIVGGLYAAGYTVSQLDSIVRSQNWSDLITDHVPRQSLSLAKKQDSERYIVGVNFEHSPNEVLEGGILKGQNIGKLFSDLTIGYHDSIDYRKLRTTFACVAVDAVTGKEIDMYSGILAESMRASMSIPGVFSPVRKDSMVLVDGGLANNYPADLARKLGADIIIGVDVSGEAKRQYQMSSTTDVLMNVLDIVCKNKYEDNRALTDVFIKVNVDGYSAASFSNEAIDTLIERGYSAAKSCNDQLLALSSRIGRKPQVRKPLEIATDTVVAPIPSIYQQLSKKNELDFGARFDTEELASVLVGASTILDATHNMTASAEVRLGKRMHGKVAFSVTPLLKWTIGASYQYSHDEVKLYNGGVNVGLLDFKEHNAALSIYRSWREIRLGVSASYNYRRFDNILVLKDWLSYMQGQNGEKSLGYSAYMQFDNQDSRVYPHSGMKWQVKYTYFTDNGINYEGSAGLHIVEGYWQSAFAMSDRVTLVPSVSGRLLPSRNNHSANLNVIGGVSGYGHYLSQQLPFAGVNYIEIVPNDLLILGCTSRLRMTTSNYLFAVANYGMTGNSMENFINTKNIFGMALGYGFKSPVGPLEANVNWSTQTKKVSLFINLGYEF